MKWQMNRSARELLSFDVSSSFSLNLLSIVRSLMLEMHVWGMLWPSSYCSGLQAFVQLSIISKTDADISGWNGPVKEAVCIGPREWGL